MFYFDSGSVERSKQTGTRQGENLQLEDDSLALCCSACRHLVSHPQFQIPVDGQWDFYRVNPAGQGFHFTCFLQAQGGSVHGPASCEYSWFSGYCWQFAYCGQCRRQLGWYFSKVSEIGQGYFAFINGTLQACAENESVL